MTAEHRHEIPHSERLEGSEHFRVIIYGMHWSGCFRAVGVEEEKRRVSTEDVILSKGQDYLWLDDFLSGAKEVELSVVKSMDHGGGYIREIGGDLFLKVICRINPQYANNGNLLFATSVVEDGKIVIPTKRENHTRTVGSDDCVGSKTKIAFWLSDYDQTAILFGLSPHSSLVYYGPNSYQREIVWDQISFSGGIKLFGVKVFLIGKREDEDYSGTDLSKQILLWTKLIELSRT